MLHSKTFPAGFSKKLMPHRLPINLPTGFIALLPERASPCSD
jgi:hypothetical protein